MSKFIQLQGKQLSRKELKTVNGGLRIYGCRHPYVGVCIPISYFPDGCSNGYGTCYASS